MSSTKSKDTDNNNKQRIHPLNIASGGEDENEVPSSEEGSREMSVSEKKQTAGEIYEKGLYGVYSWTAMYGSM
jgi:hypothetical protein